VARALFFSKRNDTVSKQNLLTLQRIAKGYITLLLRCSSWTIATPIMPSNKDRLYLGLYARAGSAKMPGKEDTYVHRLITTSSYANDLAQIPLGFTGRAEERK
jgi:hypothetical protein